MREDKSSPREVGVRGGGSEDGRFVALDVVAELRHEEGCRVARLVLVGQNERPNVQISM